MDSKYLLIDAGNTRIKLGVYQNLETKTIKHFGLDEIHHIEDFLQQENIKFTMLSSVAGEKVTSRLKNLVPGVLDVKQAVYPLEVNYQTTSTLGSDRIANAMAIRNLAGGHRLAIDIGTCIKFDFVDEEGTYQGGSISPGICLRYKALNDYTGALPLIDEKDTIGVLAKSTVDCLHSGVMNGIKGEIDFFIREYEAKYPDLTIFVTGGDAIYFDYSLKNNIFANENLTLDGLFLILKANAK